MERVSFKLMMNESLNIEKSVSGTPGFTFKEKLKVVARTKLNFDERGVKVRYNKIHFEIILIKNNDDFNKTDVLTKIITT